MPRCHLCQQEVPATELRELSGQQVCEDCYIDRAQLSRVCDPWAVHSAKSTATRQGLTLTERQQQLLELVRREQEISLAAAASRLGWTEREVQEEFAVLRHLELLRAAKRHDERVLTLFERPS